MKTYLFAALLSVSGLALAQQHNHLRWTNEGNRYFDLQQFHQAIEYYHNALTNGSEDPAVDFRLAEAYRKTFQYPAAEAFYLKVTYSAPMEYPLALYYYGLMTKLNGKPLEAMETFDIFIALHAGDPSLSTYVEQAIIEKAGCEMTAAQFQTHPGTVHYPLPAPVNTPYNDFAPACDPSGQILLTSSRVVSNRTPIDGRSGQAFSDNYLFTQVGDAWQPQKRENIWITNSPYHDGTGSLTRDGNQYYFSVCAETCAIYVSRRQNGKWTKPEALDAVINLADSDAKHPAISPGGESLFFASNRPGGFGQFDIWISLRDKDGQWQTPRNAGRMINTQANEIAPALTSLRNVLFFASDGHPGYGGLDLFALKVRYGGDTLIYNLRPPFNSVRDDCFMTFGASDMYWSSNREGGVGGFDVYRAGDVSPIAIVSRLSLQSGNDSRMITLTSRTAQSENLQLLASRNEETIEYHSLTYEEQAIVNRMVENRLQNRTHQPEQYANLSNDDFERLSKVADARLHMHLLNEEYASTLLTEVRNESGTQGAVSLAGQVVDSRTGEALAAVRVMLANEHGDILKLTNTNNEGQFRFTDVKSDARLFIRMENAQGLQEHASVQNLHILGSDKNDNRHFENIYFDFDQYAIRPEAAQVLRDLAGWLKEHPGTQVEINTFADGRGSAAYNFELTKKRGEAVAIFLAREGVDATSLAIVPRGGQSYVASTEVQRQYNRRAEFYVNGMHTPILSSVRTYIARKEVAWSDIARITGIPEEELKRLNGSSSDVVKAFQPICLPKTAEEISEDLLFAGI